MSSNNAKYRNDLMKRIVQDDTVVDHRSVFDKYIDQDALRAMYFKEDSSHILNNPVYSINTKTLMEDKELVRDLTLDCYQELTKDDKPETALAYENFVPYCFSKYNVIGEDFILETRMFNVACKDTEGKVQALTGIGFIHLVDSSTGKRLFLGYINIIKQATQEIPRLTIHVLNELYHSITAPILERNGATMLLNDDFTGLRHSLLQNIPRFNSKITGYKVATNRGYSILHKTLLADIKSMSPRLIEVLRLNDWKKLVY